MEQYFEFIGNHMFLSSAFVAVLLLIIRAEYLHQTQKSIALDPAAAIRLMNNEDPVVVDIRTPSEFDKGHIRGAVNIPLASLKSKSGDLTDDRDRPILVYCGSGTTSIKACRLLNGSGYTNVRHISGGIANWQEASLPVTKGAAGKRSEKKKNPKKSNR